MHTAVMYKSIQVMQLEKVISIFAIILKYNFNN